MDNTKRDWKEVTLEDSKTWDKSAPIEGKFVKVETEIGPNDSNMYTLETSDGPIKVWGSTVLDDKLAGVSPNTYIKIDYEGKLTSKKGSQYHSYKVFIDNAEPVEEVHTNDAPPLTADDAPNEISLDSIPF